MSCRIVLLRQRAAAAARGEEKLIKKYQRYSLEEEEEEDGDVESGREALSVHEERIKLTNIQRRPVHYRFY